MSNTETMSNTAIIPEVLYKALRELVAADKFVDVLFIPKRKSSNQHVTSASVVDASRIMFELRCEDAELVIRNTKSEFVKKLDPIRLIPSSESNSEPVPNPESTNKISRDVLDFELLRLKSLLLAAQTERDGMRAENRHRRRNGMPGEYCEDAFSDLAERISHISDQCQEIIDAIEAYNEIPVDK